MWRFLLFVLGVVVVGTIGVGAAVVRDDDGASSRADVTGEAAVVTAEHPPASFPDRDPDGDDPDGQGTDGSATTPDGEGHTVTGLDRDPVLAAYLPDAEQRGHYRAGIIARDRGDWPGAAVRFTDAADGGGALGAVAALRAGQARVHAATAMDDTAAAAEQARALAMFDRAIAAPEMPASLIVIAHREAADVAMALEQVDVATAHLGMVVGSGASSATQVAGALWARAQISRDQHEAWAQDAMVALRTAPGSAAATAALDALEQAEVAVPQQEVAYAHYRAWQNREATEHYQRIADAPLTADDAARAWFFLGALAERDLDNDTAIDAYRNSLDWDSTGPLADDARWWLGLLFEDEGAPLQAVGQFRILLEDFPDSPFTTGAAVRAGVALALAGEQAEAAAQLRTAMRTAAPTEAAEAARWLHALGFAGADDAPPASYDPTSLAAMLHEGDLRDPLPATAVGEWAVPARDLPAEDRWMAATYGPRDTAPGSAGRHALTDPDLTVAIALTVAGEEQVGRGIFSRLIGRYAGRPYELLDLARLAERAALPDVALSAAATMLSDLSVAQRLDTPVAIERYAYPLAFADSLRDAAVGEGVPPLLLAALVRQESAFNRLAGSSAGASGLTQVIPATGEQIAGTLDEAWPADLFDPDVSLRLGASYLADQIEFFDGDVLAALAAYNGGPGNAARWQEIQSLPGADGYIYAVEFTETREYLRRVIENYAWYRYLYADAPRPAVR